MNFFTAFLLHYYFYLYNYNVSIKKGGAKLVERLVKCYGYCEKKHAKSTMRQISSWNYCQECYDRRIKEQNDRKDLYEFIQKTYNLTFPTGQMLRQIKKFKDEHGYSYKNIRFTILYVIFVKKVYKAETKFGISFVPYFYDEMLAYYKNMQEKRDNMKDYENVTKVITIKPPTTNNSEVTKVKLIDMEDI